MLYRHGERYRTINWRLTATHASGRNVHLEHEAIFRARVDALRQTKLRLV
jgi:hypothetical protein